MEFTVITKKKCVFQGYVLFSCVQEKTVPSRKTEVLQNRVRMR